ncbi:MAG: hypothetical protein ACREP6_08650 [Candidatus Binataceae bacterium]
MKKSWRYDVWVGVTAAGLAIGTLCGCESIMQRWPGSHVSSAPSAAAQPFMMPGQSSAEALAAPESPPIPPASTPVREKSQRADAERVPSLLERARSSDTEHEKTSAPSLTMGDENSSMTGAQHEMLAANIKLSRVDPDRLSSEDAATYRQAADFISAARRAFDEHDYVAASSLAGKASVLASKVAVVSADARNNQ